MTLLHCFKCTWSIALRPDTAIWADTDVRSRWCRRQPPESMSGADYRLSGHENILNRPMNVCCQQTGSVRSSQSYRESETDACRDTGPVRLADMDCLLAPVGYVVCTLF